MNVIEIKNLTKLYGNGRSVYWLINFNAVENISFIHVPDVFLVDA